MVHEMELKKSHEFARREQYASTDRVKLVGTGDRLWKKLFVCFSLVKGFGS